MNTNIEQKLDRKKLGYREYMRLASQEYVERKASQGYSQRGATISMKHSDLLKGYSETSGASSMSETISFLISDFDDAGISITTDHIKRAEESLASEEKRAIGPFLKESEFRKVRGLHRTVNPRARRSMTEGLAIMIEACLDVGIFQKTQKEES